MQRLVNYYADDKRNEDLIDEYRRRVPWSAFVPIRRGKSIASIIGRIQSRVGHVIGDYAIGEERPETLRHDDTIYLESQSETPTDSRLFGSGTSLDKEAAPSEEQVSFCAFTDQATNDELEASPKQAGYKRFRKNL